MDGARPLSPIWRFGGALDFFRDFADVERMTLPEIVLEERNFGPRARSIFFVNAVRAPHPPTGERVLEDVGLIRGKYT